MRIVVEKNAFREILSFLKIISFVKENVEHQKLKMV